MTIIDYSIITEDSKAKAKASATQRLANQQPVRCFGCGVSITRSADMATWNRVNRSSTIICKACFAQRNTRKRDYIDAHAAVYEQALRAALQCIEDALDIYKRDCSLLILDMAMNDLQRDALPLIKAALKRIESVEAYEVEA